MCISAPAFLVGCVLAAAVPTPQAQPIVSTPDRSGALSALLEPGDGPPVLNGGVLAAEHGRVVFRETRGMADMAAGEPLTTDAVFQLASGAKPFTATAVLQLRDRGRLDLDDPVTRHLPDFPYPDVTLRHLLTHTAGLPDLELFGAMVAADPDHVVTGADLVPALKAWGRPPASAPGERFRYSNIGYQLLARVVEAASGQAFPDYMRDHVFRPAGMRSTYVLGGRAIGPHRRPVIDHVMPLMFQERPQDVRGLALLDARMMGMFRYEGVNLGATTGDQNLFTTLDDLRRFDEALRRGRVLSLASQAEAYTPLRLNDGGSHLDAEVYEQYQTRCSYGLGWEVCQHPVFGRIVGHAGYNRGIATHFQRNLDREQVIVVYDNADSPDFAAKAASVTNLLNGAPAVPFSRTRSLSRAYGAALVNEGPAAALILFNRHRQDAERWSFTKGGLNRLGYDLMRNGHPDLALEAFHLNLTLHPDDANLYDSLGDGWAATGAHGPALAAYRRALELEPSSSARAAKVAEAEARLAAGGT